MGCCRFRWARGVCLTAVVVGIGGCVVFASSTARADSAGDRERAARTACLAGDYSKGVALLAELFVETKDPTHIFNQARCFEQNGQYEQAILRFREFLRKNRDTGGARDLDAEARLAECETLLAKEKGTTTKEPTGAASRVEEPAVAPVALPPDITTGPASAANQGAGLRIAGLVTAVVGGAALVTGVVLNVKANNLATELEGATEYYERSKESTRKSYETFGWIGYGLGAACIAGGTVMYVLGLQSGSSGKVAVLPTIGPGGAGAVLKGAF